MSVESDRRNDRQGEQWEYGLLTRGPLQGSPRQWTHFRTGAAVRIDIKQGGEIPPGVSTSTDVDAWNKTVEWLGRERWEMVSSGVGPGGEQCEMWFKRPLAWVIALADVRSS